MNFTVESLIEAMAEEEIPLLGLSAIEFYNAERQRVASGKQIHELRGCILHDLFDLLGFYAELQRIIEKLPDVPSINKIKGKRTRVSRATNFCKFLVRISAQKIQRRTAQSIADLLADHSVTESDVLTMVLELISQNTTQLSDAGLDQSAQPASSQALVSATN